MAQSSKALAAARSLPVGVAVLCRACALPVPLLLFVAGGAPARQVACPGCERDVVLHDAW